MTATLPAGSPQVRTLPVGLEVTVRVPASSANLGPGFDALALALAIEDRIRVRTIESGLEVEVTGEGARELPRDERNVVVRSIRRVFDTVGVRVPGLHVHCHNKIPHARGLGSSAAAIVGGSAVAGALAAAFDCALTLDADRLLHLAAEVEGHPDNVAACVLGGVVAAWADTSCARPGAPVRYRAARFEPHPGLRPLVFVPKERSSTQHTRGLLPMSVPHRDAAFTAGRAALTLAALTTNPELLLPATEDRLHQGYRAPAWPRTATWMARLRASGIAATVSGAGPSVLALCDRELPRRLYDDADAAGLAVLEPGISAGVRIE
ncbi:homoserine kinase [Nocardia rhizosphaerae]|uniref:Homoserine kinase n=1 Tax=Nocardia rhizosphaerae TaxID=1691571 RepID=A0ABV8L9E9_9NOCA